MPFSSAGINTPESFCFKQRDATCEGWAGVGHNILHPHKREQEYHAGAVPFQYFVGTNGILVTVAFLFRPRTTTSSSVPDLWKPSFT